MSFASRHDDKNTRNHSNSQIDPETLQQKENLKKVANKLSKETKPLFEPQKTDFKIAQNSSFHGDF